MNLASLTTTLPMLLVRMLGIFLVIGVLILAVYLLNKVTHHSDEPYVKYKQTGPAANAGPVFCWLYQTDSLATKTMPVARGPTWVPMVAPIWLVRTPSSFRFWVR